MEQVKMNRTRAAWNIGQMRKYKMVTMRESTHAYVTQN